MADSGSWQRFEGTWNYPRAAHLLNRAGFGGLPEEIAQAVRWGMDRTVDYLVDCEKVEESFPPPETPETPPDGPHLRQLTPEQRKALAQRQVEAVVAVRSWWIRRMLRSPRRLAEKLTLFWHGHFATSVREVKNARHLLIQNEFFRQHGLGNFRDLVLGVSRDPAMLRYLDNNTNRKQHPNENYARELMELFTMGIGHYTETDVKEAARAFTGWTFRGDEFRFAAYQHDYGDKTFLGERGDLDGTDVVDILMRQRATAPFIARKLFEYFVYDHPEPGLSEELGARLRDNRYEIKPFLRTLFRSELFYSPRAWRTQIKSPAQLVIGSVRLLGVELDERAMAALMRDLGQDLLVPPSVKGWDGGDAWINTNTLLQRYNLSRYLLTGRLPDDDQPRPTPRGRRTSRLLQRAAPTNRLGDLLGRDTVLDPERTVDALLGRLLQGGIDATGRALLVEQARSVLAAERPTLVAHLIMSMPDYQLC